MLGYVFSNQLDRVAVHIARMGAIVAIAMAAWLGFRMAQKVARWQSFKHQFKLARITPEQLRDKLSAHEDILIVDLRGRLEDSAEIDGDSRCGSHQPQQA